MVHTTQVINYIDGSWAEGGEASDIIVINPATEDVIAAGKGASEADAIRAIEAARRAFDEGPWPRMSPAERSGMLARFVDCLVDLEPQLLDLAVREVGTPISLADFLHVKPTTTVARYYATRAANLSYFTALPPTAGATGVGQGAVAKEPMGVVAAITPFNVPAPLSAWTAVPAMATGNSVILKPSPYTPLSALLLAQAADEAGLPPGVLNVVVGTKGVGEQLTTHPGVDAISFTGSDVIGRQVMAQASSTVKKVVLELGGKSANVIFADVDLDDPSVLMAAAFGFTASNGQGCALTTRILVERPAFGPLVDRLTATLGSMKVGQPHDPAVAIGPLIRESQRQRVEHYIDVGQNEGAKIVFGGGRPDIPRGFYLEPTLFTDVDNSMTIAQDEIFGPVGVVIPFDDTAHAIRLANDSRYGLAASVWSNDTSRAFEVGKSIRAGFVTINGGDGTGMGPLPRAPFGGYKHSGVGRCLGEAAFDEFVELKTMHWPALAMKSSQSG
jgi:aldehyde dehydrogenase (NAD+)